MKPYLLNLQERFTQYELLYTLAMKSQYSIRLYEIFKSYEYLHTKMYEINELKKILMCEHYTRFPDFKRKVLNIALREINEFSDIMVEYKLLKESKRFAKIEFNITIKKGMNEKMTIWGKIDDIINTENVKTNKKTRKSEII